VASGGEEAAALLAVAADPVRWRLLSRLAAGTTCVCELQRMVPVAPNLSATTCACCARPVWSRRPARSVGGLHVERLGAQRLRAALPLDV